MKNKTTGQLPGWTPFHQEGFGPMPSEAEIEVAAKRARVTPAEMRKVYEDIRRHDILFVNSRYQVNVRKFPPREDFPEVISLSIKRLDKSRVGPERYRDFLRIKNEIVGPEYEGFELYPAMERNVDTANQYYMWVFTNPTYRVPVGFMENRMTDHSLGNSVNEPFEEGDLNWEHLKRAAPSASGSSTPT